MHNEVVVFSGFRSDDLKKQVEEKGGKVAASLVKATTILVVGGPKGKAGAKVDEATKRGITVMTMEAFTAKLNKPVKPKSVNAELRERMENMEYKELVEMEKKAQEKGFMQKRKGLKMTKEAVINRLIANKDRMM
jgi:BRCT domain type II-containing protein